MMSTEESHNTIVIGGGQAGLAAGYYLAQAGVDFEILDENPQIGAAWSKRWDSLRLFTPAKFNALPGMPFPAEAYYTPTKDEVAAYLKTYAENFHLPVIMDMQVISLERGTDDFQIKAGERSFRARNVIVATGAYQIPNIPSFAAQLDPAIFQLHSSAYRNPDQIPTGQVLVVGAANSGAEIALELKKTGRQVILSGRDVGRIPADRLGSYFGGRPYWWFINNALTIDTPIGRKMRQQVLHHGNPLIRSNRKEVLHAGVEAAPRMTQVSGGYPYLEDGRMLEPAVIVWATGFKPDYHWIKLPIFDEYGFPKHERGVVNQVRGLYFLGLHFQTGLTSALMGGVGKDAQSITRFMQNS